MILALETSTHICSVALGTSAEQARELRTEERGKHSEKLFLYIQQLLREYDQSVSSLEAVVVSAGPGSFTGLRIAASGLKGLLFGRDIPLFQVDTLAGFATGIFVNGSLPRVSCTKVHSVMDARRQHLYYRAFTVSNHLLTAQGKAKTVPLEKIETLVTKGDCMVGTGASRLSRKVTAVRLTLLPDLNISAKNLIYLYQQAVLNNKPEWKPFISSVKPEHFSPQYLGGNQVAKR